MPTGNRVVVPGLPGGVRERCVTDLGQALAALCVAGIALDRRAVVGRRALAAGHRMAAPPAQRPSMPRLKLVG